MKTLNKLMSGVVPDIKKLRKKKSVKNGGEHVVEVSISCSGEKHQANLPWFTFTLHS